MSIYEKLDSAMENNDVKAYADLLHNDFKFVRHATNHEGEHACLHARDAYQQMHLHVRMHVTHHACRDAPVF